MKQLIIILFAFLPISIFAQECDCASTFNWMKTTFEENDAGFQYILDKKGSTSYDIHNQLHIEKVKDIDDPWQCQTILRTWLSFFRKAHVEFHYVGEVERQETDETEPEEKHSIEELEELPKNNLIHKLHAKFMTSNTPFVEELNEHTLYLRVPSFAGGQKQLIDSVILANKARILSTENLIIDIRNGTGGNDDSYENILPFIYTNPIRMPTVEFLSTPLNNQRMYELATNTGIALQFGLNSTEEEMAEFQTYYDTLSNHLGEFVNLNDADVTITELDTIYTYPKNVGVMINQNNVSTDEQFLLEAKQSKKVKLFGVTTMGGLDVSNLFLTYSPCEDYILVYALSKSLRIPDYMVDDIGVMPDYYMDKEIPEEEWIDYVSKILNE